MALNLVPFAGIAFMWFLGVMRDRLGAMEDKFFATVFLGSGLMFLGMMLHCCSGIGGGLVRAYTATPRASCLTAPTFTFARAFAYDMMHIYAFKMAAVFMITTSTLDRAHERHRTMDSVAWLCISRILLIGSGYFDWVLFVFPCLGASGQRLYPDRKPARVASLSGRSCAIACTTSLCLPSNAEATHAENSEPAICLLPHAPLPLARRCARAAHNRGRHDTSGSGAEFQHRAARCPGRAHRAIP